MTYVKMADAAFAVNIVGGFDIAAGYYGGPGAYHVWEPGDWARFPGYRLPIWVPAQGNKDGAADGREALDALRDLGVPDGSITVVDMEQMRDKTYLTNFYAVLNGSNSHYLVWVYGSRSTVFGNPQLNGYWVADYGLTHAEIDGLLGTPGVRAVQWAQNVAPGYDPSLVRQWTEGEMWHG